MEVVLTGVLTFWTNADYRLCIFTEIKFYLNQGEGGGFRADKNFGSVFCFALDNTILKSISHFGSRSKIHFGLREKISSDHDHPFPQKIS